MSEELIPASLGIERAENSIFAQRRRGATNPSDWLTYLNAAQVVLAFAQDFTRAQSTTLYDIHRATGVIAAARILDAAAAGFLEKWEVQKDEETKSLVFSYGALAASGYAITGNFPAAQTVLMRALDLWPESAPMETALLACTAPALLGEFYDLVQADARAVKMVEALAKFLAGEDPGGRALHLHFDELRLGLTDPFEQTLWMAGRAVLHQVENLSTAGLLQQKLPHRIHDVVRRVIDSGYKTLLPPQYVALRDSTLLTEKSNALVCLPTSAGKTLLAEFCLFSHIDHGTIGFYVVPYVALGRQVADKIGEHLTPGWSLLRLFGGYSESIDLPSRFSKCIAVVTPERLDGALRNEPALLRRTSCVVVDEAHTVGGGERGVRLEGIIARILLQQAKGNPLKLVLLSAVVPNAGTVRDWIGAQPPGTIFSDWAPNTKRLALWSRHGEIVWFHSSDPLTPTGSAAAERMASVVLPWPHSVESRSGGFSENKFLEGPNNDNISFLLEYLWRRFSAAILCVCPTRDMTRRVAAATAKRFPVLEPVPPSLSKPIDLIQKSHPQLGHLARALERGVAFHNASLPHALRAAIEDAVKAGELKVVVSTTTLAEGVDLPFRATVLADWLTYRDDRQEPFSALLVRNIAGRAGRAGYFTEGDLILYDNPLGDQIFKGTGNRAKYLRQVLFSEEDPGLVSPLLHSPGNAAIRGALESQFLAAIEENPENPALEDAFSGQLLAARQNQDGGVRQMIGDAVGEFESPGWQLASRNSPLRLTEIGRAVSRSGFSPRSSVAIREALKKCATEIQPLVLLYTLLEELGDLPEQHHDKFRKLVRHFKVHGKASKVAKGKPRFCVKLDDMAVILERWLAGAEALAIFSELPANLRSTRSPTLAEWLAGTDEPSGWDDEFDKFCDFLNETVAEFLPWLLKACELIAPFVDPVPIFTDWEELGRQVKRDDHASQETKPDGFLAVLRSLREDALRSAIDDKISEAKEAIIDDDTVAGAMAETNATGFYIDDYQITSIEFDETSCRVSLSWHASGDQDEDRPYSGDEISGTAIAIIDDNGDVEFDEVSGAVVDEDDIDFGDDPPDEPGSRG